MRGSSGRSISTPAPRAEAPPARTGPVQKQKVLFVCIGNSCRSPMAEAFARAYGSDVMEAQSAGLAPAAIVQPLTKQVLQEKNVPADDLFPKELGLFVGHNFDVIVNLSGMQLPIAAPRMLMWPVTDPIGQEEHVYRRVAERIEHLVMGLILELRSA